jgi:hypothetical protein
MFPASLPRRLALSISALTLALAGFSYAHAPNGLSAWSDDGVFNWAIISDEGQSMSGKLDSDLIQDLKARYKEPFLLIRDGDDQYVITDRKLVERGQRAAREIQKYGREIGEIARTQASLALSDVNHGPRGGKLEKRRDALENEIRSGNPSRERLDEIEQELFRISVELQALEGVERGNALTPEKRSELTERREVAKERLDRGIKRINQEMRGILKDAKAHHIADEIHGL